MPGPIAQLINGKRYDHSSVEITIGAKPYTLITSISYQHSLEPGVLRGTSPHKLGRTRGQYEASGSVTMYKAEYKEMVRAIKLLNPTVGYMEVEFPVTVTYQEVAAGELNIDKLLGCRITSAEHSSSEGSDPVMVSFDIDIMKIIEDGDFAVLDNTGLP